MLSRLRRPGLAAKLTQSLSLPLFTIPIVHTTTDTSEPKYDQPMKKPILTGRNSTEFEGDTIEEHPNPFMGKDLPFGRKILMDNHLEEDLASGNHWHAWNDRFMQHFDIDFVERAYGNTDLYKSPMCKRGCDDITMNHDLDYHYKLHNIGMHLEMVRYVPHLAPLWPELKADFESVTAKWQDIVEEILGERSDSDTEIEKEEEITEKTEEYESGNEFERSVTKIQTKKTKTKTKMKKKQKKYGSYQLKTSIIEDRPLCGEDVVQARKQKIRDQMNPDPNKQRRAIAKRQIELSTIKKFIDDKVEQKDFVRLIFVDAMGTKFYVYGMVGETLLQCCRRYLVPIDGYCDGYDRGIVRIYGSGPRCHLCQMDISPKYFHLIPPFDWRERLAFIKFRHIQPTSRLGCCIWIRPEFDGMLVNIPVSLPCPYGRMGD